ncbi:MAG: response regulator [Fibromonadaceae bacterium]|jgi:putative two-component system response regulator|nr:response regulator [Fibromonadaceae bacterium]
MKTVFIVDDSDISLSLAEKALESQYRTITLPSATKMFAILEKMEPDLILLDISMPEMDGPTALQLLKNNKQTANIPVIFLTGQTDADTEVHGFELGAVDFIAKPFTPIILLHRVKIQLDMDEIIRERTAQLEQRTTQLEHLYENIVSILADVVESRDNSTGGHIERTTIQTKILIEALLEHNVYTDELSDWNADLVASSARLHDLGKIAIPDSILNKPGELTPEEYEIMKRHVAAGEDILNKVISKTKEELFWHKAKLFASYHHERWNGTGYPRGLKGMEIPLHGRILALIDVYDALVSERPYKKAFTHEKAVEIIMSESGKHFDPKISEVFYKVHKRFRDAKEGEVGYASLETKT